MNACITKLATAVPSNYFSQTQTTSWIADYLGMDQRERHDLSVLHRASGVSGRYSVLPDFGGENRLLYQQKGGSPTTSQRMETYRRLALPLAAEAAQRCLKDTDKHSISHLILISCTGMYAPGLDVDLLRALSLPSSTHRTAITFMGCFGALSGLKLAAALALQPNARVLLVCVELCTLHFQLSKSQDSLLSSALFADGAAAVVVEKSGSGLALQQFETELLPSSLSEMTWQIGNHGFLMGLSSYVPELIGNGIQSLLSRLNLKEAHLYAIHPGGKKILQTLEPIMGLDKTHNHYSYQILKSYGNMSSATFLFVLEQIWLNQRQKDKSVLGMAFGPGLTIESAYMKFC